MFSLLLAWVRVEYLIVIDLRFCGGPQKYGTTAREWSRVFVATRPRDQTNIPPEASMR